MKNTVTYINSLDELSTFLNVKIKHKSSNEKTLKCKKCGNDMSHIENTNIYICTGKTEDGKDCGNIYYKNVVH